jgi:hypothetical protein
MWKYLCLFYHLGSSGQHIHSGGIDAHRYRWETKVEILRHGFKRALLSTGPVSASRSESCRSVSAKCILDSGR